jgi:agmatinase
MHPFSATSSPALASPEKITASLRDNVYVSIDLDVFDPSIMPAVGTPEPGGMQWHEVLNLLRTVTLHKNVIGFDLVELCPKEGPASCAFLTAKLAYKLIGYAIKEEANT